MNYLGVADIAMTMPDNTTLNGQVCPQCGGGQNKDRSLSITKTQGSIKWICFRAKCGYKGVQQDNPNNPRIARQPAEVVREYEKETFELEVADTSFLSTMYDLSYGELQSVRKHKNYWVFPVKDIHGRTTGMVHKKFRGEGRKSIQFGPRDLMHWEVYSLLNPTCVVVEDWLSAKRVGKYVNCVALLGTHMSSKQACALATHFDRLLFMLDEDAWGKAAKHCMEYDSLFREGCRYTTWEFDNMSPDPKDLTEEELITVLTDSGVIHGLRM